MPRSAKSGLILIVEDPFIRRYVKSVLGRSGHEAVESGAQRALKLVRDKVVKVRLMITNKPGLFRQFADELPILYLAMCPDLNMTSGFRELRVLQKPFRAEELLQAVQDIEGSFCEIKSEG
jgi:DNA-binding response OmpR family regulator